MANIKLKINDDDHSWHMLTTDPILMTRFPHVGSEFVFEADPTGMEDEDLAIYHFTSDHFDYGFMPPDPLWVRLLKPLEDMTKVTPPRSYTFQLTTGTP